MADLTAWTTLDPGGFRFGVDEVGFRGPAVEVGGSFADFIERHNPTLLRYEHVPRMASVADRVVSGELKRVLVIMPPRYFKSEVWSRLLPAYFLRTHPALKAGLTSYGADLAWSLSEESRNYFVGDGGGLLRESTAKKRWMTSSRGEMWAAGVGGPLLGFGYHLGVVDDPTDPEKAHSPTFQRKFREWWPSKFLSRQEPDARIVVVMQRLGLDDPIDYLLRRELGEGDGVDLAPERWHVVLADEIRSAEPLGRWEGPGGLPPTCTLEPDDRPVGAPLAPSRFSLPAVEAMQSAAGPLVASTQRQGRPFRPTGDFWREGWFAKTFDELPDDAFDGGVDWDTAYTKDDRNSASAFVESYRGPGPEGRFPIYVNEIGWEWYQFPELVAWMAEIQGPHFVEKKASGKSAAQVLRKERIPCTEVPVLGDKFSRASSVQRAVAAGRVWVRRSVRDRLLLAEPVGLLRVTNEGLRKSRGALDLNDAFVQALTRHIGTFEGRRARLIA